MFHFSCFTNLTSHTSKPSVMFHFSSFTALCSYTSPCAMSSFVFIFYSMQIIYFKINVPGTFSIFEGLLTGEEPVWSGLARVLVWSRIDPDLIGSTQTFANFHQCFSLCFVVYYPFTHALGGSTTVRDVE